MEIIKSFLNVEEGHLYSLVVKTTRDWAYAKTDFFHWIGVLNRFDDLLEKMVKKYELPNQKECLNEVDKATILGIIKITEHLWDNATNRNLYSSYEHLFSLLYLVEMDVVHELMKFLIRPASRLDSQKSLRTPFMNAAPTFQLFADRWPISVLDGLGGKVGFPNSIQTRFYRTAQELKEINDSVISPMDLAEQSKETLPDHSITSLSGTATEPAKTTSISPSESTIPEQSIFKTPKQKKSKVERELKTADSPFSNTSSDNHLHVSINIPTLLDCSDSSILSTLDKVRNLHHLSGRRSLEVLIKIRLGTFINVVEKRHMMLSIRLLALSILCSAYQEDVATEKIFMYEPELIQNLTQALILDTKLPLV